MVAVLSEGAGGDLPTFCHTGTDVKVSPDFCPEEVDDRGVPMPGVRGVDPVTDTAPIDWYVRIVFSELLDPSVEDLTDGEGHISGTKPVTLTCGGTAVDYDGFYDPAGNEITFPPGPGLVVTVAGLPAATGSDCEVAVNDVPKDKDGNAVATAERGPYTFTLAPMEFLDSDPADGSEGVDPAFDDGDPMTTDGIFLSFNAYVGEASLAGKVVLKKGTEVVPVTFTVENEIVIVTPDGALDESTEYTLEISPGVLDAKGGSLDEGATLTFTTGTNA